jgi:hypothetical protein
MHLTSPTVVFLSPSTRSLGTEEKSTHPASKKGVTVLPSAGGGLSQGDSSQDTRVRKGDDGFSLTMEYHGRFAIATVLRRISISARYLTRIKPVVKDWGPHGKIGSKSEKRRN